MYNSIFLIFFGKKKPTQWNLEAWLTWNIASQTDRQRIYYLVLTDDKKAIH